MKASWRRRVLQATLLLSISLAGGLLLGEALVRLVAPQQLILKRPDIWKAVDGLGWTHRENLRTTVNTGERTVSLFTDARGFRVGASPRHRVEKDVLLLGDSFVEALQVEHEQSIAGLLEAELPHRTGQSVAIHNAAVGGWDPPQYVLQAESALAQNRFDLVLVFLYIGNDVVAGRPTRIAPRTPKEVHAPRIPRSLRWSEIVDALLYPVNDFLEIRSHLFIFLKIRAEASLMRVGLSPAYFPIVFRKGEASSPRWEETAAIGARIDSLARDRGARTLFVLIPSPLQIEHATLSRYLSGMRIDPEEVDLEQPNRLLTEALDRHCLRYFDVLDGFRRAEARGMELFGKVDRHLSPAGHGEVVRLIAPDVGRIIVGPVEGQPAGSGTRVPRWD